MALKLSKGNLTPAKLTNKDTGTEVKCMFNPFEYTLTKQNQWTDKQTKGKNAPKKEFSNGGAVTLTLSLHFDTLPDNSDVRSHTDPIWKMMMISDKSRYAATNKSAPPGVKFEWGGVSFEGVVTNLTQKFTLFNEQGTPVRCTVDLTITQALDTDDTGQGAGGSSSPATVAPVIAGQRLDNTVASTGASPDASRSVAAANNVDNPLKPTVGQNMVVSNSH